jgi:hypothetical protein
LLAPQIAENFDAVSDDAIGQMHPRIRASFQRAVATATPMLIACGVNDEGFESFQVAMNGELGAILRPLGDRLTLTLTEERIHGFMTLSGQEATIDIVMSWLDRLAL